VQASKKSPQKMYETLDSTPQMSARLLHPGGSDPIVRRGDERTGAKRRDSFALQPIERQETWTRWRDGRSADRSAHAKACDGTDNPPLAAHVLSGAFVAPRRAAQSASAPARAGAARRKVAMGRPMWRVSINSVFVEAVGKDKDGKTRSPSWWQ